MKNILTLMVLINYKITQVSGVLEWTVIGKVTEYGQNVTLFCHVPNCCPQDAGWDRWTPVQRTLFIDVKTGRSNKKYDGRVMKDGYALVIQNLTKHDLNVSYSCLYGVTIGEQKLLLEDDAFTYFIPGQTADQTGKSIVSKGHIAGIMVGVVLTAAAVALFFHNWRRRKKKKFKYEVPNEDLPLIVKDGSHIEYKEGEDAKLIYESQNENLSVKLFKPGNIHTEHEYRDDKYNFVLRNTKTVNSGEYTLQVGRFFRKKFQLQITAYFLEDPTDIECNEGEEAIITCKVHPGSPSVNWFKNDNDLSENDKFGILSRDGQHQLKVLQSKLDDNGEYCVHVGKSLRKVQLTIKAYFLEEPTDIEFKEGEEAIISCKVHPGSPSVKWFKNDNDLSGNKNYEISSREGQLELKVLQSKLDDNGEYCVYVGKSFRKVQLNIKAYFLEEPSDIEVKEGDEAIITCKVYPGSPSVNWFKNDNDLSGNKNFEISSRDEKHQLKVLQSKLDDNGEYCVHVGKSLRKVQLKIKAHFLEDPSDIECMEGDEAIITCKVHHGSPSVKLFKNDNDLSGNNNYEITSRDGQHQLKVLQSKLDDNGEYRVHVGKSLRKVKLTIKAYFLEDPIDIEGMEGDEAIIICKIHPDSPSVKWFKNDCDLLGNNNYEISNEDSHNQLKLLEAKLDDSGEYCVHVGKFFRKVQLKIKAYFLKDPSDIECMEGDKAIITCKVQSDDLPVKWLKNGNNLSRNDNYEISSKDGQQKLKLLKSKLDDNGEYCVQVRKSFRKVKLNIKAYFLEDPNDIECKEGEEAIITCKVHTGSPFVKWLKNDNDLSKSDNCRISSKDTQHQLKLLHSKLDDNGEYCVHVGKSFRKVQLKIKEIPNEKERIIYDEAIQSGNEVRKYVRIQVIGKDGVGKTSLVRRLLNQDIEDVKSTDGIDINRNCHIKESDGTWIFDNDETEMEKIGKRILHAVELKRTDNQPDYDKQPDEIKTPNPVDDEKKRSDVDENGDHPSNRFIDEANKIDTHETVRINDNEPVIISLTNVRGTSSNNHDDNKLHVVDIMNSNADKPITNTYTNFDFDKINEEMVNKMDDITFYVKNKEETMAAEGLVECGIWDFAGQKEYYATHQTFLTPHAIYLLVADITDDIQKVQYDDNFNFDSSGDYIDFWLDSIHCYCEDIKNSKTYVNNTSVIMVCTGIDKLEGSDKDIEIKKNNYERKFLDTFGCQEKGSHIRGMVHFISNVKSPEEDFRNLRDQISAIAKEMRFFADNLPTKWIQLENVLAILKDLKKRGKIGYCEKFENIEKLAKTIDIEKNELLLFLKYQHKIGNVIFFDDKCDYIILQPNWLIDCFKCLICDNAKQSCSKAEQYILHYSGMISDQLIDRLFSKVPELMCGQHKPHILEVMGKFDIIVKPKSMNAYYIPCMITEVSTLENIKKKIKVGDQLCTPWLVLAFKFLPIAYYNHILFMYIREKTVCKEKCQTGDGRPALYAGKAVVYLDKTKQQKLVICFSRNAISLQIWNNIDMADNAYRQILRELCNSIDELGKQLNHTLKYKIKSKCSTGDYLSSSGRISYEDMPTGGQYYCDEHGCKHDKEDIENTWFKSTVEDSLDARCITGDATKYKKTELITAKKVVSSDVQQRLPSYPQYESMDKRLKSFKIWTSTIKPEDLANAGFFYSGKGDKVQCFFCAGILSQWKDSDIPIKEHTRCYPACPFIENIGE